jgi:hypothetical protein
MALRQPRKLAQVVSLLPRQLTILADSTDLIHGDND